MVANVFIDVNDDVNENDLQDYLSDAVLLDINTEEEGDMGVQSIEIDWTSLRFT
jgi:hypothetical protein